MSSHPLLPRAYLVTSQARYVTLNTRAIEAFSLEPEKQDNHWLNACPEPYKSFFQSQPLYLQLLVLGTFHSIGFCYFPQPRWTITLDDITYDGAVGLWLCLMNKWPQLLRQMKDGFQDSNSLAQLLGGTNALPFLEERRENLRLWCELTKGTEDSASLIKKIWQSPTGKKTPSAQTAPEQLSALTLALKLESALPSFRDRSVCPWLDESDKLINKEMIFAKRAQLLVSDWHYLLEREDKQGFLRSEELTAFADYKIPQLLRELGLISYQKPLEDLVDRRIYLNAHSQMEVEVRAATITTIDLLSKKLKLQANKIDNLLWRESQKLSPDKTRPYHRTLSLAY